MITVYVEQCCVSCGTRERERSGERDRGRDMEEVKRKGKGDRLTTKK